MAAFGKADAWYLTFADLLTLLLCFFLAVIGMSPLNPYSTTNLARTEDKHDSAPQQRNKASGTDIASNNYDAQQFLVSFGSAELSEQQSELTQNALKSLISQMIVEGYQVGQVLVRTCSQAQGQQAWQQSQQLAVNVSRQLIDAGIRKGSIKLAPLGPLCSANGGEGESLINVKFEKFIADKENGGR